MQQIMIFMVLGVLVLGGIVGVVQSKQGKSKGQPFNLVLTALFVAISIVLAQFRVYIPLFGFPSLRFSVSEIPIFLIGAMLGGVYGAMAGFASDIISFVTAPQMGAYHFGFTLNLMLVGFIPGVIFKWIREERIQVSFEKLNKILGATALVGALGYINYWGLKKLDEVKKIGPLPLNIAVSLLIILLAIGIVIGVSKLKRIYAKDRGLYSIDQIFFVVSLNYIVVSILLTPIWIGQIYNEPIIVSTTLRLFKSVIDVPLQVTIIYMLVHAIPVKMREKLS